MRHFLCTLAGAFVVLQLWGGFSSAQEGSSCDDLPLPAEIECLLEAADAARDPERCRATEDPVVAFQCISIYAERHHDHRACGLMTGSDQEAQTLRASCIAGVAIASGNAELCPSAEIELMIDTCYVQLVLETGADSALCARVANPLLSEACRDGSPHRE